MTIAAATVWEVRTTGVDTNGGGFVTGAAGIDRSQQDAAHAVLSAASVVNATTTIIDVSAGDYTCTADDVGNILQITGGTATAGFYQITARSGQQWTLDRSAGTVGQTVVGRMGGALLTPGKAGAACSVAGNTVYIKAGTYTITSASTNIAGGCVIIGVRSIWEGYQTTRGDLGTKPLLQASGISTFTLIKTQGVAPIIKNIAVDGAGLTSSRGMQIGIAGDPSIIFKCHAANCTNTGLHGSGGVTAIIFCTATGCSASPAISSATIALYCEAYDNTNDGFSQFCVGCISYGNTGHGFSYGSNLGRAVDCVAYGNGGDGFNCNAGNSQCLFVNCIAEGNTGFGFEVATNLGHVLMYCATFGNTAGAIGNTPAVNIGQITGTGSFFTDAPNDDFTLNNTAGAGAALRAAALPALFPAGLTANYRDIGAAQHLETGGGGGSESFGAFIA